MKKTESVRRFVIQHIIILTSNEGTVELIKRKKQEFISQHSLKSEDVFTNVQIARDTLQYLIETRRLQSPEAVMKTANSSPFLKKYLHEVDVEAAIGDLSEHTSTVLAPEDISKLSQAEFIAAKTQELKDEAKKKAEEEIERERARLKELQAELEDKMKIAVQIASELDKLPEAVDPENYVTDRPESGEVRMGERALLWWERLGLSGDPFPTKKGLYRIPEEKYEEVVVRTEVFRQYLEVLARRPQDLFGKTILIMGEFGSGKTTFLQYISHKTTSHNIMPIQVILEPMADPDLIRENLYSAITEEVSLALKKRGASDPRAAGIRLDINRVLSILRDLAGTPGIKGFLLTINGLHKAESTLDSCLEFLKQLQNFHESMDSHDVNMCILIEGSPLWTRVITQNPAFSGSFYRVDQIPELSPEGAFKLLQNRIKAFEPSADIPVFLDKSGVEFAFRQAAGSKGGTVTFRSFIDYVLPRLEKGEYGSAGISVAIDREAFEKIHLRLKMSTIADAYELYRKRTSGKSMVRRSCRAVLDMMYRKGSIEERDEIFRQNRGAYWVLDKCRLIQKVRTRPGFFGWGLSKDLLAVLELLNEQGMPPDVIFRCFSMDPERFPQVNAVRGDPNLTAAQDLLARWEAEWPELKQPLTEFMKCHELHLESLYSDVTNHMCDSCQRAIRSLIVATQSIMKTTLPPETWVEETWMDLSAPETIISVLTTSSLSSGEKFDYVLRYKESARELLDAIDSLLKSRRILDLTGSALEKADLRGLFSAAVNLDAGDVSRAIDDLNSRLEHKIRATFHIALSLRVGPDYETYCPESVRRRMDNIRSKLVQPSGVEANVLYHFSRGEYAELVKSSALWEMIFKSVFSPRSREEVVTALQKSFLLDTRRAHRDRPDYFRTVIEDTRQAIVAGKWLLESMDNIMDRALHPPGLLVTGPDSEPCYQVSFNGQQDVAQSFKWKVSPDMPREILSRILKRPSPIDISIDSLVAATFGCSLPEMCVIVADLLKQNWISAKFVDGKSHIRFQPSGQVPVKPDFD